MFIMYENAGTKQPLAGSVLYTFQLQGITTIRTISEFKRVIVSWLPNNLTLNWTVDVTWKCFKIIHSKRTDYNGLIEVYHDAQMHVLEGVYVWNISEVIITCLFRKVQSMKLCLLGEGEKLTLSFSLSICLFVFLSRYELFSNKASIKITMSILYLSRYFLACSFFNTYV